MALPKPTSNEKKDWPKHEPGMFQLALADVIYLGKRITENFTTHEKYPQERIALVWQSMECEPGTPKRFELATEFTYTLSDKGNLRKFLAPWLGPFATDADAEKAITGLDAKIGANVMATIVHNPGKRDPGKVFVNVATVGPLPKKMEPFAVATYTRNPFWQKKIDQYAADYAAFMAEQPKKEEAKAQSFADFPKGLEDGGATDGEDELPFN